MGKVSFDGHGERVSSLAVGSLVDTWGNREHRGDSVNTGSIYHHDGLKINKERITDLLDTIIICHLARGCKGHYSSSHHTESLP